MNALAGWLLGASALLLGGLWMPALIVAIVAVVFNAAKPEATPEETTPTESEEVATLDVRTWMEPMPTTKTQLGPERMRYREPLIGECSIHDCPTCGEGLVSVRVYDGHPVKRCNRCC